jgi:CO/xanthine dehydrogenase FAD-binding subunit
MRNGAIGVFALALLHLLPSYAAAVQAPQAKPFTIENLRIAVNGLAAEERAQRALEAREKVERNRRCRPAVEKAYAEAIDNCKKTTDVERFADRRRCFGGALERYYTSLRECSR